MIAHHGELFTFTDHFNLQLRERGIQVAWVEAVLDDPDTYELSQTSGYHIYDGYIAGYPAKLRVVLDEDQKLVITTYFVTRL